MLSWLKNEAATHAGYENHAFLGAVYDQINLVVLRDAMSTFQLQAIIRATEIRQKLV
jgi:hypothetical protein